MTRRRKAGASSSRLLLVVFAVSVVVLTAALLYLARSNSGRGERAAEDRGDFGDRIATLAARRGAAAGDIQRDDPIRKVDGVFVRTWRIALPTRNAADLLANDLAAEASSWQGELGRQVATADGDVMRLRVDLKSEAFDLHLQVSEPKMAEGLPSRQTPEPTPTATPRPTPPPSARGRLAVILDDGGQDVELAALAAALPAQVAVSILPFLPHSADTAAVMHRAGHEVWLHLPMEPTDYPKSNPGPGAIYVSMAEDEIRSTVHAALNSVPHVVGVNNHMGSRATAALRTMTWVMQELKARGMVFVDSRTTVDTVAEDAARAQGVPVARRHIFLDNQRTRQAIRRQLDEAVYRSRMEGELVAIGHLNRTTLAVLQDELPGLAVRGADLVPPSTLCR